MKRYRWACGLAWFFAVGIGTCRAGIYIEPYLQDVRQDGVTIVWWTDSEAAENAVHVGGASRVVVPAKSDRPNGVNLVRHVGTLRGLEPETTYPYHVRSGGVDSDSYSFSTAVRRGSDFGFVFVGDGRNDSDLIVARHRAMAQLALSLNPHFLIDGGDAVMYGSYATDQKTWESLLRLVRTSTAGGPPLGSWVPQYFAVGNHEIYDHVHDGFASGGLAGTSMARFRAFTVHPGNGSADPNWRGRYYSFEYGCATFVVLDLNNTSDDELDNHDGIPDGRSPDWEPGSEQYGWMIERLAEAQRRSAFTFVVAHPSPYSRGVHGTPYKEVDSQRGYELRVLDPVFRRYGVDAVLTSHDHIVEHSLTGPAGFWVDMDVNDPRNLNYLVQGNAGEGARDPHPRWKEWMQIDGAPAGTTHSVWFYDWNASNSAGVTRTSLHDVRIRRISANTWEAAFQVVSIDDHGGPVRYDDRFSIRRTDPTSACAGDLSRDGDVDGSDLSAYGVGADGYGADLAGFAIGYGRNDCPRHPP